jgi:glycosyltransferase involved in cell wall biosynthesis
VPNGLPADWLGLPADDAATTARADLGLPQRPTVAVLGRLCRQKGQDRLLKVWPIVRRHISDAQLILIGGGASSRKRGRPVPEGVIFAGHRPDPRPWLLAADVVAVPARWDGMSFALLEALVACKPVVATDVSGAAEVVKGSGTVLPDVDEDFATAIVDWLTSSTRLEQGLAARERVLSEFTAARMCQSTREIYDDLLAGDK